MNPLSDADMDAASAIVQALFPEQLGVVITRDDIRKHPDDAIAVLTAARRVLGVDRMTAELAAVRQMLIDDTIRSCTQCVTHYGSTDPQCDGCVMAVDDRIREAIKTGEAA